MFYDSFTISLIPNGLLVYGAAAKKTQKIEIEKRRILRATSSIEKLNKIEQNL